MSIERLVAIFSSLFIVTLIETGSLRNALYAATRMTCIYALIDCILIIQA